RRNLSPRCSPSHPSSSYLSSFLTPRRPPTSTPFPTRRSSDLGPPDMLVRRIAIPRQRCQTAAICGLESDGNSASHTPDSHASSPDRKSTRLNSSHVEISYAVFCLKKKKSTLSNATRKLAAMLT